MRTLVVVAMLLGVTASVSAQDSSRVIVRGRIEDPSPWVGNVRVQVNDANEIRTAWVRAGAFVCGAGGGQSVQRPSVVLDSPPQTAVVGQSVQLTLHASSPHAAVQCEGPIEIAAATGKVLANFTLVLEPYPTLRALDTTPFQLSVVACSVLCDLVGGLTGLRSGDVDHILQFENPTETMLGAPRLAVTGVGQSGRVQLASAISLVSANPALDASRFVKTTIRVRSNALPPDKYAGQILLSYPNYESDLTLPVEVSVRAAPWMPIVYVLVGVLIGMLSRLVDARKAQLDLLVRAQSLLEISQGLSPRLRLFDPQLADLHQHIVENRLDGIEAQLSSLEVLVDVARQLDDAQRRVNGVQGAQPSRKALAEKAIEDGIVALGKGDASTASSRVAEVRAMIPDLTKPDAPALRADGALGGARALDVTPTVVPTKVAPGTVARARERIRKFGARLTLPDALLSARWMLHVLTILLVSYAGLQAFYLGNPTFGAAGWRDYWMLLVWGFSADATGRTLTDVGRPVPAL